MVIFEQVGSAQLPIAPGEGHISSGKALRRGAVSRAKAGSWLGHRVYWSPVSANLWNLGMNYRIYLSLIIRIAGFFSLSFSVIALIYWTSTAGFCRIDSNLRTLQSAWWIMLIFMAVTVWDDWDVCHGTVFDAARHSRREAAILSALRRASLFSLNVRELEGWRTSNWSPEFTAAFIYYIVGSIVGLTLGLLLSFIC